MKGFFPLKFHCCRWIWFMLMTNVLLKKMVFSMALMAILSVLLKGITCLTLCTKACAMEKPPHIKHKYFLPGDFITAGILSQFYMISDPIGFTRHPSEELVDEIV